MRTVKLSQPDAWRQIPPMGSLRPWITDRDSLTARIVEHVNNFNLVRLTQHLAQPNPDEFRAIGLPDGVLAMVREVLLRDGDTPLVFAHTAVNPRDLRGAWRGLSRLGGRPLAEMLFHDPTVMRMPMEYRRLNIAHPLSKAVARHTQTAASRCWARRSVFLRGGQPLLVTEVFLPAILVLR